LKNTILSVLVFLVLSDVSAQNSQRDSFKRNSFWTENLFIGPIKGKFKYQLDYQYRRMSDASDAEGASLNMFKNPAQHVYRPWVHYQMNDNVRFSISPLGFWETYTPAVEAGGVKKIQPEYRICPQVTLNNKFGRMSIDQRYRYEYRMFGLKVPDTSNNEFGYAQGHEFSGLANKNRFRYFIRATIPLGNHQKLEEKTLYIVAWNEIFLGFGGNTNNDKIWDQNRTFCLLGYKPKMDVPMRFEAGYGLQYANRFSSSSSNGVLTETGHHLEKNNIFQVFVIFENFNKLFVRKKEEPKP
jgi:hypothetical protein